MFLDYFWQPVFQLLPEWETEDKSTLMTSDLSKWLAINTAKSMWLFFTPNWNFGRNYTEWWEVKWVRTKEKASWWNCFFIDFDIKDTDYQSLEEYREAIASWPLSDVMKPSFVHKSWWWYHVYWLFDDDAKTYLSWIDKEKVADVWKFFTSIFLSYWADTQVTEQARLMRYPWSFYYKKVYEWAFKTEIYSYSNWTLNEFSEQDMPVLSLKDIQNTFLYYDSHKQVKVTKDFWKTKYPLSLYQILDVLDDYEVTSTWRIRYKWVLTEWYRYNKIWDYVTDFSWHDRPRWNAISFLYHHFDKDWSLVRSFVDDNWLISEDQKNAWVKYSNEWVVYSVKSNWWYLSYFKEQDLLESKIFWFPVKCTSRTFSSNVWNKTYENNHMILTFETDKIKLSTTIPPTVYDFNKKFASYWILFWWNELEYRYYSTLLLQSPDIPELITLDEDWYFDKWVYVSWSLVYWEPYDKYHSFVVDEWFALEEWKDISVQELTQICLRYRSPKIVMPCILSFISLRWMNLYKWLTIYPWLLFSWRTRTGKSTMMSILMRWMWLDNKFRLHSINNMTPQPLQEKCTRYCPAFFEEFTPPLKQDIEQVIRNVLNRDTGSRWRVWWNYVYEYRSPICMVWETRPSEQSVTNRLMITSFKESDKTWAPLVMPHIDCHRIYKNVFDMFFKKKHTVCDDIKNKQWVLISLLWNARMADTYAPMFVMNDYFNICPQNELVEYVLYHMDICWLTNKYEIKPMSWEDIMVWLVTTWNASCIISEPTRSITLNIKNNYMINKLIDISHYLREWWLCETADIKDNGMKITNINAFMFDKLCWMFNPSHNVIYAP